MCNTQWAYSQLKIDPNIHFSKRPAPPGGPDPIYFDAVRNTSADTTVECYLPADRLVGVTFREPGLYVKVLPRPRGWPVRPEGGFTDNTQGFDTVSDGCDDEGDDGEEYESEDEDDSDVESGESDDD